MGCTANKRDLPSLWNSLVGRAIVTNHTEDLMLCEVIWLPIGTPYVLPLIYLHPHCGQLLDVGFLGSYTLACSLPCLQTCPRSFLKGVVGRSMCTCPLCLSWFHSSMVDSNKTIWALAPMSSSFIVICYSLAANIQQKWQYRGCFMFHLRSTHLSIEWQCLLCWSL